MVRAPWLLLVFLFQTDYAAEGRKALEANNPAAAEAAFRKAVEADANDWPARFHLGLSLSLQNKDAEAIEAYRKVMESQPDLYEVQLNLGMVLVRQKQPAEAVKLLEAAAAKKPAEYRPAYYLAEAWAGAGEWSKAEAAYRTALTNDAKSAEAAVGLARTLVKLGRLADADPFYRQAVQVDPEFKRALLELAGLYEQARQPEKAIPLYREFPDDAGARERLGELLLEGGKAADAVGELEKAYQQSPTPANRLALATAYLKSAQAVKALPLLEQAVAAEPKHFELRMYYGRALRDQRTFQAAAREFLTATQIKADSKEAWSELAGVLILLENYPQALVALDRAQALSGGENAAHYYFRAIVLDRMKDYKNALPSYQKFLEMSQGKHPDEEFKSRQRIRVIQKELNRR